MGIPHYHHCTGDCPDGLTAAAVAASIRPDPVVPTPSTPRRDLGVHTPGAGWALAQQQFDIEISEEDLAEFERRFAEARGQTRAVPTHEEHTERPST